MMCRALTVFRALMNFLKRMFAVVHLVKPQECRRYEIDGCGELHRLDGLCFDKWGKGGCCENCIFAAALRAHRSMTRVEFVNNRLYGITASSIIVNGDELFLFFRKMPGSEMRERLEKILHTVENTEIPEFPRLKMTISIGGASADGKLSQSIIKADAAMYDAKNIRNSIRMYSN